VIAIRDLRHAYDGREVLAIPEWSVGAGEACLVAGRSGSGKSTLLAIIAALLRPTSGSVRVGEIDVARLDAAGRDRFRARVIGFVPQRLHLIGVLDVRDNLRVARRLAGLDDAGGAVDTALEALDIAHLKRQRASRLSVGEAQRVAIARAVVNHPKLILADEPTSALDDDNCEKAITLLAEQAKACAATLLVATHDRRLEPRFARKLEL
jgi:putative ABC transport system ATP-binding protein